MGEMRTPYKILVGKPEGKRPFDRPTRRWNNTELIINLREMVRKNIAWTPLT
jgi:hypothetical protein